VIGDVRQGPEKNNGEFHEALTSLNSLVSAGLMGIDKTNQHGFNYVKMAQNYFNSDNKWNIVMNNTYPGVAMAGGGYGRDWWYDVYPNVLYYGVAALFPNVENTEFIQRMVAEQFYKADSVMNGNYDYSYFDYAQMKGMRNQIPLQQDAASPVAIGDGPKWVAGQPQESMFSLYSTSIAGVFGAIVNKTGIEGILALNCNATDFYAENKYPVYLYYNPYEEARTVTYSSDNSIDLFDIVSKRYMAKRERDNVKIKLPAGEAALVVVLPAGTRLKAKGSEIKAGDTVIAYK
jgi:hypothetical protein